MTTVRIYFREDGTTQADLASYFEKNNPGEENEDKNHSEEENEEKNNPEEENEEGKYSTDKTPRDMKIDSNESRESMKKSHIEPRDMETEKLEEEKKDEKIENNYVEIKENPDADARDLEEIVEVK